MSCFYRFCTGSGQNNENQSKINKKYPPKLLLGVVLCACFLLEAQAEFEEAHQKWAAYQSAMTQMEEARERQDMETVQKKMTEAAACLRGARHSFEKAGIADSEQLEECLAYVEVLETLGYADLAAEVLEGVVAREKSQVALWLRLAKNWAQCGPQKRHATWDALQEALQLEPASAEALSLLGDFYWDEGLYAFAQESYVKAHAASPTTWTTLALAILKVWEGNIGEASTEIDALGGAGQAYDVETRERLRTALAEFTAAQRYFSDTAENHMAYARLLYRAARLPEAIMAIERAVVLAPKGYQAWNFLAAMQMQLGNLGKAREAYEYSLQAHSDQPQVRAALERLQPQQKAASKPLIFR